MTLLEIILLGIINNPSMWPLAVPWVILLAALIAAGLVVLSALGGAVVGYICRKLRRG